MMEDASPKTYYALYDILEPAAGGGKKRKCIGNFDKLTGGDMKVSMIPYTQVLESGATVTKYVPGQATYAPVSLLRAFDGECRLLYQWYRRVTRGRIAKVRRNFSIGLIDYTGKPKVIWNLINAFPTAITGFSFNQYTGENYADFELTIQAEYIELRYQ